MLPNILSDYLDRVEQAIQQYSNVDVERYEEEILTPIRANLRIRLRFNQTHLLEIPLTKVRSLFPCRSNVKFYNNPPFPA